MVLLLVRRLGPTRQGLATLQLLHRWPNPIQGQCQSQHVYRTAPAVIVRDYVQAPKAQTQIPQHPQQQQQEQQQEEHHRSQTQSQLNQPTSTILEGFNTLPAGPEVATTRPKDLEAQPLEDAKLLSLGRGKALEGKASPTMTTTEVEIPYPIDWIFPRLRNPSKFWYVASQLIITAVGLISKFVLGFMSKTRVYNRERLLDLVARRPKGVPLVTVSNHHSCFDDPGLWGILPVRFVCNTRRIRWSMAAHDICFTNKNHSLFFMYGKCIPVVRGIGVYQEAINLCIEKCALGHWVHVFPEGKVNMTKEEMRLKWGIGRIIYESPTMPIILPMWHEGMDDVLPNVEPYVFKWRKNVTVNIGEPLDLNGFVQGLKDRNVGEPEARKLITDKIQDAFRDLRLQTEELHKDRK